MSFDSILVSSTLAQQDAAAPTAAPAAPAAGTGAATTAQPSGGLGGMGMMLPLLLIGGMIVMMFFSNRKQKKEKEAMNSRLQKGAKVTTIGGARGKVAELSDTEVTVQFDDCRIAFLRSAIQSVDEVPA